MKLWIALTAGAALAACSGASPTGPAEDKPAAARVQNTPDTMAAADLRAAAPVDYLLAQDGPYPIEAVPSLVLADTARGKDLQVRITFPDANGRFPVIVWSHGARGSKDIYEQLVQYWASHGYVCIQPNHSDSRDFGLATDEFSTFGDWGSRPADLALVIDSLDFIGDHVNGLAGRMDKSVIGAGGHSFGAHTAQLFAGATPRDQKTGRYVSFADPRPKAFLLMSPQGTGERESGLDTGSWRGVDRPVMVVTGSNDPGRTGKDWRWRLDPFLYSPPEDKYLLYIDGAYHGFGGVVGSGFPTTGPDNPVHARYAKGLTLAFWDAYLKGEEAALALLRSGDIGRRTQGEAEIIVRGLNETRLDELGRQGTARSGGVMPSNQIIERFDSDGDGLLSGDEMPPRLAPAFTAIDRDRSGRVSADELDRFFEERRR